MTTKNKYILIFVALATSFAIGRYSLPEKVRVEVKTVEVEKKFVDTEASRDKHRRSVTVEVVRPDGTKEVTTTVTEDSRGKKSSILTDSTTRASDTSKEVTRGSSKVTISALAGAAPSLRNAGPLSFGLSVTKPILGPFTVGIFGLTSPIIGASVGLTF